MKVKLSVYERLVLLNILPKEGNFITLKILRQIREELSFNEKEIKDLKLTSDPVKGTATWIPEKDPNKEIEIGRETKKIIVEVLEKLDKDSKLSQEHLSLYEKFVEEKKE
jgi:hypothetical protein